MTIRATNISTSSISATDKLDLKARQNNETYWLSFEIEQNDKHKLSWPFQLTLFCDGPQALHSLLTQLIAQAQEAQEEFLNKQIDSAKALVDNE